MTILTTLDDYAAPGAFAFLRRLGLALRVSRPVKIEPLASGEVDVTMRYPSLSAMHEALTQKRALKAMLEEEIRALEELDRR